jgi:SAM-dependent methyltransferase
VEFESYTARHRHVLTDDLPPLLREVAVGGEICDLGCGDGAILYALSVRGLLTEAYAVDLAPEHVRAAQDVSPVVRGIVADVTKSGLPDSCADGVIVSQVIEHLPDDEALAPEIARLLRPNGWWYVGSVIKGKRGWWIYKVDGVRRLDPTHTREYSSAEELEGVLATPQLRRTRTLVTPMRFPVTDLIARALIKAGRMRPERMMTLYTGSRFARAARKLRVRIPGYYLVEVAGVAATDGKPD